MEGLAAGERLHRNRHLAEVGIHAAELEVARLVEPPARVARLAERRVGHQQDHPPVGAERPVDAGNDGLELVHVLDREQKDGGVMRRLGHALAAWSLRASATTNWPMPR